jgi:hypothetical protein
VKDVVQAAADLYEILAANYLESYFMSGSSFIHEQSFLFFNSIISRGLFLGMNSQRTNGQAAELGIWAYRISLPEFTNSDTGKRLCCQVLIGPSLGGGGGARLPPRAPRFGGPHASTLRYMKYFLRRDNFCVREVKM